MLYVTHPEGCGYLMKGIAGGAGSRIEILERHGGVGQWELLLDNIFFLQ